MSGKNSIDYSTMAVTDTAKVLSTGCSPVMPQCKGAVITIEDADVRYREDGTAPTAAEGILLEIGDNLVYDSWTVPSQDWRSVLRAIQFIRTGTVSAALKIHWYD